MRQGVLHHGGDSIRADRLGIELRYIEIYNYIRVKINKFFYFMRYYPSHEQPVKSADRETRFAHLRHSLKYLDQVPCRQFLHVIKAYLLTILFRESLKFFSVFL